MTYLTATIVTYNNPIDMVRNAVQSFLATSLSVKLYLIDNSPNEELKLVCNDERIEYHHTGANIGFGAAHNIILQQADKLGTYHIILNPDIVVEKGTLEGLVAYMDAHRDVAGVNPKITYPNGDVQHLPKLYPTPVNLIIRFVPYLSRCFSGMEKRYMLADVDQDTPYALGILSGCFMMIRSSHFSSLSFDERFFMYFEDFDLSRRLAQNNRLMMVPSVSVIHHYARGSRKSFFLFKTFIRSMVKYFNKYGWLFDPYRKAFNQKILSQFR